ncbi:MAG: hypothetical protein CVU48_10280 [Candidatus Cloacimonetes bacterium HGW-Cloacimonetes-1]|jgi:hypothetical protein|nr:MAG: hypothetical protein CVU48_10280 [Candidatus Cloacimonetes bacterium HGW-Cloacimonetes-1]
MGLFQDHSYCEVDVENKIEVEARVTGFGAEYSLIINDQRADRLSGISGNFILRGLLKTSESERTVLVFIHQGLFGTKYKLEIDGQEYPLTKVK